MQSAQAGKQKGKGAAWDPRGMSWRLFTAVSEEGRWRGREEKLWAQLLFEVSELREVLKSCFKELLIKLSPHRIISLLISLEPIDLHLQNPFTAELRLVFDWITGRNGQGLPSVIQLCWETISIALLNWEETRNRILGTIIHPSWHIKKLSQYTLQHEWYISQL